MIRVADYIAEALADHGITDVFLVTGGGAMHLNDAIGRCRRLKWIACHHEQTCAVAAESYYRLTNRLAAVNVTTGPGGTNAITGVYGAYMDSCGMVVVSGQVKWETLVASTGLPLRQLGDQEADIVRLVTPITKYAVQVTDPLTIRYHLERAIHLARTGRPGPTWVDVPMNVQSARVDPSTLRAYDPREDVARVPSGDVVNAARDVLARIRAAKRPVIYAGSGVRLARAEQTFRKLADALGVPIVTGFNAQDLLPDDHPAFAGRPGTIGDRAGNFVAQNADFILVIGCRLNIRQLSYNWGSFARAAYKVMVDIDAAELHKPTLSIDLPVHADAGAFLEALLTGVEPADADRHASWMAWGQERRTRYPVVLPEYWLATEAVNPYCFVDALFRAAKDDDVVVTGDGTACVATFQAARVRGAQRLYSNSGCASMGWDLPAAIGAAAGSGGRRVLCLAGDGSLMMNVQDLATVRARGYPVKLFLLNNGGYHSIRQTQNAFFPDNEIGVGPNSGVSFPDWQLLAAAFGIAYQRISNHSELESGLAAFLASDDAGFCEIVLDRSQPFAPKLSSRRLPDGSMVTSPLEDMAPFLSREELASNMLVPAYNP